MDKKYLAEHNLIEAQKKFQRIVEYSSLGDSPMDEADDLNNAPAPDGTAPVTPDPNTDSSMDMNGGMDNSMGGPAPDNNLPATGDPSMGNTPPDPSVDMQNGEGSQGVPGFQPQGDPNLPLDAEQNVEPDEDIVDVDDLTNSQEATEKKVDKLSHKLDRLEKFLDAFDKIESDIQANTEHLEQLRQDFEKRNPTQVEKMSLRAKQGYPFSQTPDDFWNKKEAEGNYSPEDDNNGIDDERYQITKNDVDNITDWNSIYKSINNGSFHPNLRDVMNF